MKRILAVTLIVTMVLGASLLGAQATEFASVSSLKTYSGGAYHAAAIKPDGSLWAWGSNSAGQIGLGDDMLYQNISTPTMVFENGIAQVSCGGFHTMAITDSGDLYAWGQNSYGQIGSGGFSNGVTSPVFIMSDVAAISSGFQHSLAIKTDGTLWAWGRNDYGQLGTGAWLTLNTPTQIMEDVVAVTTGTYQSAAIKSDGTLWTWGWNTYGQLATGNTTTINAPVQVMSGYDISSISMGNDHTAIVTQSGDLYMCGGNVNAECGMVTENDMPIINPVLILQDVALAQCGNNHTLALKNNGELYGWGWNLRRQVDPSEDATTMDIEEPTLLLENVDHVASGADFSLAVMNGNELYGWGWNNEGELGQGTYSVYYNEVLILDEIMPFGESQAIEFSLSGAMNNGAISLDVNVSENSMIRSGIFTVTYDPTVVSYTGATEGTLLSDGSYEINATVPGQIAVSFAMPTPIELAGVIMTLEFDCEVINGIAEFSLGIDELIGEDTITHLEQNATAEGTTIEIEPLFGDINFDGVFNTGDVTALLRYCVEIYDASDINIDISDVNADNVINSGDAAYLIGLLMQTY